MAKESILKKVAALTGSHLEAQQLHNLEAQQLHEHFLNASTAIEAQNQLRLGSDVTLKQRYHRVLMMSQVHHCL